MKHLVRDGIVLLVSWSGLALLYRAWVRRRGPLVRVLCFHDVQDATWFSDVIALCAREFRIISPATFQKGNFDTKKINVLLTFDDGYASWVDICLPILEKHGAQGVFFINSGLLDQPDGTAREAYVRTRLLLSPKHIITWDGVRTLVASGHTVGGHSIDHLILAAVPSDERVRQVTEDKRRIESETGRTLTEFAYPFGRVSDYSSEDISTLKAAGYEHAYTTVSAFAHEAHPYTIPRTCLEHGQGLSRVRTWIMGGYDIVQYLRRVVRS